MLRKKLPYILILTVISIVFFQQSQKNIDFTLDTSNIGNINKLVNICKEVNCIKPINKPKFENIEKADMWLEDDDPVIGVSYKGVSKAYPHKIMVWHQIVNDRFKLTPVAVIFCPTCNTGNAFISKVNGKNTDFGVSGKMYDKDLVMFDEKSRSLWGQASGVAISGEAKERNEELEWVSAISTSWGNWKKQNPETLVLSQDTGFDYDYSLFPYANYSTQNTIAY